MIKLANGIMVKEGGSLGTKKMLRYLKSYGDSGGIPKAFSKRIVTKEPIDFLEWLSSAQRTGGRMAGVDPLSKKLPGGLQSIYRNSKAIKKYVADGGRNLSSAGK